MTTEIPTTREGILALYEEVKPELQDFLADMATVGKVSIDIDPVGMARARELEYTLNHGGITK